MNQHTLHSLVRLRWRVAIAVSALMVVCYFGFILLIAFNKSAMSVLVVPGLSVGIVLGAMVIALTIATTWFYVRWVNRRVDGEIERLKGSEPQSIGSTR
jgi:uncharacterized membrane protein (DUF485 family)